MMIDTTISLYIIPRKLLIEELCERLEDVKEMSEYLIIDDQLEQIKSNFHPLVELLKELSLI